MKKVNKESTLSARIAELESELMVIRENFLYWSPVRKFLLEKISCNKEFSKILTDEDIWIKIESEIDLIYPGFNKKLENTFPNLTITDIQFCYLSMFEFDTNQEAILLGITPDSVSKRRTRIRAKLNVDLSHSHLCHFLKDFCRK